ncbi:MAG: hypothetical protein LBB98_02640 [Treponema sp.]|jgi:hypothetical protein|nr:hypothetical protein [Treponema sp.]
MKSYLFPGVFAGIFVSLLVFSCAAAPPPVEEAPQERRPPVVVDPDGGPPDQAALDNLQKALSRVGTSRKQALDIDSPGYFSPEWDAAEGQFAAARENAKEGTLGDVKNTIALYNAAAESYDTVARKCLPLYYQDLSEEILQVRDEAIDAGIRNISPARLEAADKLIDQALEFYEAGETANAGAENYYAAAEAAFGALARYHALSTGAQAYRLREEIEERGFTQYDAGNYGLADESMVSGIAAYDSGEVDAANDHAEEAFLRYTLTMNQGWLSFAGDLRASAEAARRKALSAKANVAVRQEFSNADGVYTRGNAAYNAQDYAGSSEYFSQVIPLFLTAAENAEAKRVVAEEAISTAETRVSKSEKTTLEAAAILQGGTK